MGDYTIPCQGIVAYSEHEWKLEDLLTREPKDDEILVDMIATGVCHTDISGFGGIYPRVLGHEGAGRIIRLGSEKQRERFSEGSLVILSAACCQTCFYCKTGHPAYCLQHAALTSAANEPIFVLASDTSRVIGGAYFGQSSFASPVPVKVSGAANVTRLIKDDEELKMYAPLGCGIMTGAGAITHVAKCKPDDVVAVVGIGGVGLAAVCAAKKLGVRTIVAVDLLESRIELARSMGATHSLLSSPEGLKSAGYEGDFAAALKAVTPQDLGCTYILDNTPSVAVLSACLGALQNNGSVLQVGIKPSGAKMEIDLLAHMVHGRRLVGVIEGDRDPIDALPELIQWCKDGVLPLDKLLKEYPVVDHQKARESMQKGDVIKGVLVWP